MKKLGGFIKSSANTVSAPFHPFGGAVDIIVVAQQDGSFKSSPWYVRFGKFQGVLKLKEKLVSINVNGVDADFNMYLDHKGEAYFLRDVEVAEGDSLFSPSSLGEDTDGQLQNRRPMKTKSLNFDSSYSDSVTQIDVSNGNVLNRTNSKRSRILRYVFGRKSIKGNSFPEGENVSRVVRAESLERAELAADLLDVKWSTNLISDMRKKDKLLKDLKRNNGQGVEDSGINQNVADSFDGSLRFQKLENSVEENSCVVSEYLVETVTLSGSTSESDHETSIKTENAENIISGIVISNVQASDSLELEPCPENMLKREGFDVQQVLVEKNHIYIEDNKSLESEKTSSNRLHKRVKSCSVSTISRDNDFLSEVQQHRNEVDFAQKHDGKSALLSILGSEISEEEQLLFGDLEELTIREVKNLELVVSRENEGDESSDYSPPLKDTQSYANDDGIRNLKKTSWDIHIDINNKEVTRRVKSLPNMSSLNNTISNDLGHSPDHSVDSSSNWSRKLLFQPDFICRVKSMRNQDSKTNPLGDHPSESIDVSGGGSIAIEFSEQAASSNGSYDTENLVKSPNGKDEQRDASSIIVKKIITLTPTSEQLATLNLKEGRNIITFTFSTSMLGKQQVDARIYLWRWDTRIVISDVDGTITRSDVLGQFMPFVGVDWSHSGVAHLFSAIKENGYQLIFLSARAVSQAYQTRQFLLNLKQDGKSLPDGPVVISPDGLFPSLFREVVRRAPHEFKIACLEEIKALFPSDRNPFYAGFGNRETDELSYLKVGIPIGKIFIINPKGEIVVNRQIETKSYPSIHALVNRMFPPAALFEEEKFNSYNFWKLPPPAINIK